MVEHSYDPSFYRGSVNFDYLPWRRGGSEKLKKGWKYGAGSGLLRRG